MKTRPLIERYLTYLRVAHEQARARIRKEVALIPANMEANLLVAEVYSRLFGDMAERAQKYRLSASGQAMVEALRPRPLFLRDLSYGDILAIAEKRREPDPDIATPIVRLPGGPVWVELEQPIFTNMGENAIAGVFFASSDHEVDWQLSQSQRLGARKVLEQARKQSGGERKWSLHFIAADGRPSTRYEYVEDSHSWSIIPDASLCPTGECIVDEETSDLTGRYSKHLSACAYCNCIMGYWRSWFVTCLLALQGEFATSEASTWQVEREATTRKVRRPGTARYDEVPVVHDYYLVQFDASVKRAVQSPDLAAREARGSWVTAALEVDPDSVVYVRHDFGQVNRRLDPARNPRWREKKVVEVRAHARRVPMRVSNVQKRITRVVASAYKEGI